MINQKTDGIPQLITRIALGIGFLVPVSDRLGLLGPPGPATAWGDWKHFTTYAHSIMPFLPEGLSDFNALVATIFEVVFGICLLLGFKTRLVAFGSAMLTLLFAIFMIISNGIMAPIKYPVFVFVGAGLLLACVEHPKWSIDSVLKKNS